MASFFEFTSFWEIFFSDMSAPAQEPDQRPYENLFFLFCFRDLVFGGGFLAPQRPQSETKSSADQRRLWLSKPKTWTTVGSLEDVTRIACGEAERLLVTFVFSCQRLSMALQGRLWCWDFSCFCVSSSWESSSLSL
jgi:hypothetical protein